MSLKRLFLSISIIVALFGALYISYFQKGVVVEIGKNGFSPSRAKIKKGEKVVFRNNDKESHWPASNIHPTHNIYSEFDPKKPIEPGSNWSFVFEKEGEWRYHDHLYPKLKGQVIVSSSQKERRESLLKKYTYDDSIQEDSEAIFSNTNALFSYVKKFGVKETVQYLHKLTAKYGDCHQNAHETGRMAYEIFNEETFQTCSAECHSGCYHGATEAYFREHGTTNLAENLKVICSSELNPFFSHQCIHGIGHGLMAFADYEIHQALQNCDLLDQNVQSCYTGVFMENVVGGLAQESGHNTKYLNENPHYPCTTVEERYKNSCYFYQTSRMMQLFEGDFSKVAAACREAPEVYQTSCFQSMGRDVGGVYRKQGELAIKACGNANGASDRIDCLIGAVQDTFWDPSGADTALAFCRLIIDVGEKDTCYSTIFSRAKEILASEDLNIFCSKTEESYTAQCLNYIK